MDLLNDFKQKDMIAQINTLDEITRARRTDAIPVLFDLYAVPVLDQAVDEMVYHTLIDLLDGQDAAITGGLRHDSPRIQTLCIRKAGQCAIPGAQSVLADLLQSDVESTLLSEIIRAFGNYKDPALVDLLLPYLQHDDYAVVAWAMRVLSDSKDVKARDAFIGIVTANESAISASGECDLPTALAIESLGEFSDQDTIRFLVSHIHHPHPTLRRIVIDTLVFIGVETLPALKVCLVSGDKDEKLMAANIIGWIGDKHGADILLSSLGNISGQDLNIKFAIYEALGRINSIRSIVGLKDGLEDEDEMVLMAVVTGLDGLCNPGVVKVLQELVESKSPQCERVLQAIVAARAKNIFREIYNSEPHAEPLMEVMAASPDKEAVTELQGVLEKIGGERAAADMKRLSAIDVSVADKHIVAADDSKAMLFFYKSAAAELGLELVTALDGKEALEYMQAAASDVDLLITDMNMPNMDGIELTRELRKDGKWANLPILMATTESESSQSDLARQAGVSDFISKPFSKDAFKNKIAQMLGQPNSVF